MPSAVSVAEPNKATFDDALLLDADGKIYDRHIEDLFNTLFHGKELDVIFRNNFRQYSVLLIGPDAAIPDGVFDNVTEAQAWVSDNLCAVAFEPTQRPRDPELAHCRARAHFVGRVPTIRGRLPSAYAPTTLDAVLMCAVIVYRHVSTRFHRERMEPASKTKH